jgi:hypothetical protein
LWYLNHKDSFNGKSLSLPAGGKRQAAQPVGSLTTNSGYTVSSVNAATLQVTSGQSVFVDFVATNGAESVNLVSTVSYGAAGGAAASSGVSVGIVPPPPPPLHAAATEVAVLSRSGWAAASGSGAVLSTGAIIGIAIGGAAAVVLLAGVTAAVAVGAVVIYKKKHAREAFDYHDHAIEVRPSHPSTHRCCTKTKWELCIQMEAQGSGTAATAAVPEPKRAKRSTWFERRKLFQSITGRSPPVRVDN